MNNDAYRFSVIDDTSFRVNEIALSDCTSDVNLIKKDKP